MRRTSLLIAALLLIPTVQAGVATYEFTGTATSKTGVFAGEATNVVTGTVSIEDTTWVWPGIEYEEHDFYAGGEPLYFVDPFMTITVGSVTRTLATNNAQEGIFRFFDQAEDQVRIWSFPLHGEPEQERFTLFTGNQADALFPGSGSLSIWLVDLLPLLDNPNFLSAWPSPTGSYWSGEYGATVDEVVFTWDSFRRVPPDTDGDGIEDGIDGTFDGTSFTDEATTPSNSFTDQGVAEETGTTFGTVTLRGDMDVSVGNDLAGGVNISAANGTPTATVNVCGFATLNLTDGDNLAINCGSVQAEVESGPVEISLGMETVVSVPESGAVFIEEVAPDSFAVENTGEVDVTVDDGSGPITVTEGSTVETGARSVAIDVLRTSCINPNNRGNLQVAIFGAEDLDVTSIDVSTLELAGLAVRSTSNSAASCKVRNIDNDGYWDYRCQFQNNAGAWSPNEDTAILTGELLDGTRIEGEDTICVQ